MIPSTGKAWLNNVDCSYDKVCLSKCSGGKCPSSTFSCSTALNVTCCKCIITLIHVFLFLLLARGIAFESGGVRYDCKCKIENKMK